MLGTLKGKRLKHSIDPHKDIAMQPAPAQKKSLFFKEPSSDLQSYITNGQPIEIYIEVKSEQKVFGKNDIEYKLYNKEVQTNKVY